MHRTRVSTSWLLAIALLCPVALAAAQDAEQVKKGEGNKANPLDGVGAKLSAEDIKAWITHPTEAAAKAKSTKKPPMPAKYGSLPAADLDALVAYMQSLK